MDSRSSHGCSRKPSWLLLTSASFELQFQRSCSFPVDGNEGGLGCDCMAAVCLRLQGGAGGLSFSLLFPFLHHLLLQRLFFSLLFSGEVEERWPVFCNFLMLCQGCGNSLLTDLEISLKELEACQSLWAMSDILAWSSFLHGTVKFWKRRAKSSNHDRKGRVQFYFILLF